MTTGQSVSTAVAQRETGPAAMIQQYRADFTTVLPSHMNGATWVRLAQGVLRRDKNLSRIAQQNPASLMRALLECARLGHEPDSESFYLVPMGNEIEGWEGYRGVIERMYRAGAVSNVKCEVVRSGDTFEWSPTRMTKPTHEADWFGDRGEIIGAYSYAEMRDGSTSKVIVLNQSYLDKVKKESRGSDKATSPWQKWPEAMVLKTAIHRLEPFVPTSSEYMREQLRAIRDVQAEAPRPLIPHDAPEKPAENEVIDGEVVNEATGEVTAEPTDADYAAWNDEANADRP